MLLTGFRHNSFQSEMKFVLNFSSSKNTFVSNCTEAYRYGFNGVDIEGELNSGAYFTEFRIVDSRLGRWFSKDPVVKQWESSYAGFANNPIAFKDPNGLDPVNREVRKYARENNIKNYTVYYNVNSTEMHWVTKDADGTYVSYTKIFPKTKDAESINKWFGFGKMGEGIKKSLSIVAGMWNAFDMQMKQWGKKDPDFKGKSRHKTSGRDNSGRIKAGTRVVAKENNQTSIDNGLTSTGDDKDIHTEKDSWNPGSLIGNPNSNPSITLGKTPALSTKLSTITAPISGFNIGTGLGEGLENTQAYMEDQTKPRYTDDGQYVLILYDPDGAYNPETGAGAQAPYSIAVDPTEKNKKLSADGTVVYNQSEYDW